MIRADPYVKADPPGERCRPRAEAHVGAISRSCSIVSPSELTPTPPLANFHPNYFTSAQEPSPSLSTSDATVLS